MPEGYTCIEPSQCSAEMCLLFITINSKCFLLNDKRLWHKGWWERRKTRQKRGLKQADRCWFDLRLGHGLAPGQSGFSWAILTSMRYRCDSQMLQTLLWSLLNGVPAKEYGGSPAGTTKQFLRTKTETRPDLESINLPRRDEVGVWGRRRHSQPERTSRPNTAEKNKNMS